MEEVAIHAEGSVGIAREGLPAVNAFLVFAKNKFMYSSFEIGPAMDAVRVRKGVKPGPGFVVFPVAGSCAIDIRYVFFVRNISFCLPRPNRAAIGTAKLAVG